MKIHEFELQNLAGAEGAAQLERELQNQSALRATLSLANHALRVMAPDHVSCKEVRSAVEKITTTIDPDIRVGGCSHEAIPRINMYLEGLRCADCAQKIENAVTELPEVEKASLAFASQTLSLTLTDPEAWGRIFSEVQTITEQIEPGTTVHKKKPHRHGTIHAHELGINRRELIRISLGAMLSVLGFLISSAPMASLSLFLIAYGLVGSNVLMEALRNLRHGDVFNEQFLMAIASLGAFLIGAYPEAVAVMLFYNIGEWAQDRAVDSSRNAIEALVHIQPEYANRLTEGAIEQVHPQTVAVGNHILVKPGERIPLDGRVLSGTSSLDTSAITGESLPRDVGPGDTILSGCINLHGVLTLEVTKRFEDSAVALILDMVENAGVHKAPTEKFITRFARYYTPAVVAAALALAFLPPLLMVDAELSTWVYRALVFLVASCPCALVISIPLSFFAGIGAASKKGILLKGGNYIERLAKADVIAFDKTGTLTQGRFSVTKTVSLGSFSEEELLQRAALVESHSNHPIARAFDGWLGANLQVTRIHETPGHGLEAVFEGRVYAVGNAKLMALHDVAVPCADNLGTTVYIAIDGALAGYFVVQDVLKEGVADALAKLKSRGVHTLAMLTGDTPTIATSIGDTIGLDRVYAGLLPRDKVTTLENLAQSNPGKGSVIYVGDGINDAPVLTAADVGIAMGKFGSDAAIEAADVVITTDEIERIVDALALSKKTMSIAKQNIVFALGVKGVILSLGALGFASMWAAVFADVGVALLCVLNASRVLQD